MNNSPGNFCLHISGNLKHFIGAILGNTGYKREREKEYVVRKIDRAELVINIEETRRIVMNVIKNIETESLNQKYPINVFDKEITVEYFLIYLLSHPNYHLGQINYLRRIIMDEKNNF